MASISEVVFGPWTMILIGAFTLAALCVLLPAGIIVCLRLAESLAARSYETARSGLARGGVGLRTRGGLHQVLAVCDSENDRRDGAGGA